MKRLHDDGLDAFRDGVAELRLDGEIRGHVASYVEHFWSPGRPLTMQERVFLKVTWTDGRVVEVIEDYPTWKQGREVWSVVDEMRDGALVPNSHDMEYSITWLEGDARDRAWLTFGPADGDPFPA